MSKKIIFICFLIFTDISMVMAQSNYANYMHKKLDNGLEVLIIEDASVPVVQATFAIKEGAAYLPDSTRGIAFLNSLLFLSANEKAPAKSFMYKRVSSNYLDYKMAIYNQTQLYSLKGFYKNLDTMISILYDAVRYPVFMDDEIKEAVHEADSIKAMYQLDASYFLNEKKSEVLNDYGFNNAVDAATFQQMKKITRDDLITYRNKFYQPSNTLLIICGAVNRFELLNKIQLLMGSWKNKSITANPIAVQTDFKFSMQSVINTPLTQFPVLQIVFEGPNCNNHLADYNAGFLLKEMLTADKASLKTNLVNQNLAYDLSCDFTYANGKTLFTITCIVPPDKLKECYATLIADLNNLITNNLMADNNFMLAVKKTIYNRAFESENVFDRIKMIAQYWVNDDLNSYYSYNTIIQSLTLNDLKIFAQKYLIHKPSLRLLLISPFQQGEYQTEKFLVSVEKPEDAVISFAKNEDSIDNLNRIGLFKVVQFIRMNPEMNLELQVNQDNSEKKDLVKKRYITLYKKFIELGLTDEQAEALQSSLYIRESKSENEQKENQCCKLIRNKE